MKIKVVNFSELGQCERHILSAEHWIPEHRVEDCNPELIQHVKDKAKSLGLQKQRDGSFGLTQNIIDNERTARLRELEVYRKTLRKVKPE